MYVHIEPVVREGAVKILNRIVTGLRKSGNALAPVWIYVDREYSVSGKPRRVTEPYFADSTGKYWNITGFGFGTQNVYNTYGVLEKISEINTGYVYHSIASLDVRGQVTEEILGVNGILRTRQFNAASGLHPHQG